MVVYMFKVEPQNRASLRWKMIRFIGNEGEHGFYFNFDLGA